MSESRSAIGGPAGRVRDSAGRRRARDRNFRTSGSQTLGIIIPDITIGFFADVIRGAEAASRQRGYTLIATDSTDSSDRESELLSLMRFQRVDGILLAIAATPTPAGRIIRSIEAGTPVVCVDRTPPGMEVDSVLIEDRAAAQLGIDHLLANGYRKIAIITGPLFLRNEQQRLLGCLDSLRLAGIDIPGSLIWNGNLRPEDVAVMCHDELRDPATRPEALFCTNGPTALGALRGLRERGLRVPEDMGFATFDELTQSEDIFHPGITTVIQPAYAMGFRAVEILLERIAKGGHGAVDPFVERLSATLEVRESSRRRTNSRGSG